jgi:hypothetical protein
MSALWFLVSALHEPYVLAFEPSFVEIRHIETGLLSQVIQGSNLRLLFADTPPSVTNASSANQYNPYQQHGYVFHFRVDESKKLIFVHSAAGYNPYGPHPGHPPPHHPYPDQYPRHPQGVGREEILIVSDDRVLALRPRSGGPQRYMSDNISMASIPR